MTNSLVELKGFVSNPHTYHGQAKIFVLPADIVYANYSLLESMSHGAVPIVADGEGASKIVNHGKNGLIIPKDPVLWSQAIESLLGDPDRCSEMSRNAQRTVLHDFSISAWVSKIKRIRARLEK